VSVPVINLADKLASFADAWNPRIVAELNGQQVRLAKLEGAFVWHAHEDADELFLVVEGEMTMGLRDRAGDPASEREVIVRAGELIVVPRAVEHRPAARPLDSTCSVLLFEPAGVVNTGTAAGTDAAGGLTRDELERL